MTDRTIELGYWLTSEDPEAVKWRKEAPLAEKAAALREYRDLLSSAYGIRPEYIMMDKATKEDRVNERRRNFAAAYGLDPQYVDLETNENDNDTNDSS